MPKTEFSISHKSPCANIFTVHHRSMVYHQGVYFCNLGTIMIHSQKLNDDFWALFCFFHEGKYHYQSCGSGKVFSHRRLAVLAGKFAREVFHSEKGKKGKIF